MGKNLHPLFVRTGRILNGVEIPIPFGNVMDV